MISSRFLAAMAPVLTGLTIVASVWLWLRDPTFGVKAGFSMGVLAGFMPTVWLWLVLLHRRGRLGEEARQTLLSSLSLAGALLLSALGLQIVQSYGLIGSAMPERTQGIMLGILMMIIGNALPKTLKPLRHRCSSAREQALQRFAGWMFVLAGFGYALAWAVLPKAQADLYALPALMIPVGAVIARLFWVRLRCRQVPS